MKKIILPIILTISMGAFSQTFEWLKTPETEQTNFMNTAYSVTVDADGNVYYLGFKENPIPSNYVLGNLYLNKYNSVGQELFSKTIAGKCASFNMVSDSQGNIVLALSFSQTMTVGTVKLTSVGDDAKEVLVKLDNQGNYLWSQELSIEDSTLGIVEDFRGLAVDSQDNIYAGYDNFFYSYITKFSPTGQELMTIEQENANRITCVAVDTEGNIYATGGCSGLDSKYAGVAAPTDFQYNIYLVKYTPQGNFQWIKYVEDITCPEPHVAVRTPDEVYFSSYLFTDNNFDDIEIEGPLEGFEDFFLAKVNAQGEYQWVREVLGDSKANLGYRNYLSVDNSGNVYIAGSTNGEIDWGNGVTTATEGFQEDAFVIKYNPDGIAQFAKTAGGSWHDRFDGISANSAGELFLTGVASGSISLDNIEHESTEFENYPFLAKINMEILGNVKIVNDKIIVYPNPADTFFSIKSNDAIDNVELYNMLGQKIKSFKNPQNLNFDISDLPQGAYLLIINRLTKFTVVRK